MATRGLLQDVRLAWRGLRRRPWIGVAAVLTFGAGIGINAAVFSVVDRVLVRGLPYHEPDRLVTIRHGDGFMMPAAVGAAAAESGLFDGLAVTGLSFAIPLSPEPDSPRLTLFQASATLLRVLGVRVSMGRDFLDDDAAQRRRLALVSHESWRTKFRAAPDVTERIIGDGVQIVGVLPEGFIPPSWAARPPDWDGLILDSAAGPSGVENPNSQGNIAGSIARLGRGVTPEVARADLLRVLSAIDPSVHATVSAGVRVEPVRATMFERDRPGAALAFGASGLLLLLACVNLSMLLVAHGRVRERDAAIAASMGATRWRLVRQGLAEAAILCTLGTMAAFAVLLPAASALASVLPPLVARHAIHVTDLRVLAAAAAAAAVCAVATGIGPALRASRVDLLALLQRTPASTRRERTLTRATLLAAQTAFAVLLAVSAMLLLRSFNNLQRDDVGFQPRGLYTVFVAPMATRGEDRTAFDEQAAEVVAAVPGIANVAFGDSTGVGYIGPWSGFTMTDGTQAARYEVSANYFQTLESLPVAGRTFTSEEVRARARIAVVNVSAVKQLWPDVSPEGAVGRLVPLRDESPIAVVGVVPNVKPAYGISERPVRPAVFVPFGLHPAPMGEMVVRTATGEPPNTALLQQRIQARLAGVTSVTVSEIESRYLSSLQDPRFRAALLGTLALTGLLLAALGLLAVVLFDARQREYEIAVRLSHGATARDIQWLIVTQACRPVAAGLAAGLLAAYWATAFLQQFLYQIEPRDTETYLLVAGILAVTAVGAAWGPAWRAGRVHPAAVLRVQ